jgi:hypothetical protein
MRVWRRCVVCPCAVALLVSGFAGQCAGLAIAANPMKTLMGLINLEVEVRLTPHTSLHVFLEYLVRPADHPRWVLVAGPRVYADANLDGLYGGLNLLLLGARGEETAPDTGVGVECGYRMPLAGHLFVQPRILGSKSVSYGSSSLGFEALLGWQVPLPGRSLEA